MNYDLDFILLAIKETPFCRYAFVLGSKLKKYKTLQNVIKIYKVWKTILTNGLINNGKRR